MKLVGSTISCEAAHEFGGFSGQGRHNPHVQSYIVATDQVCNLAQSHASRHGVFSPVTTFAKSAFAGLAMVDLYCSSLSATGMVCVHACLVGT